MRTAQNLSRAHYITLIEHHEFEGSNGLKRVRLNLNAKTYGCKEFDYFQLPCYHAIAAAIYRNVNMYILCSPAYTLQTLINAYVEPVCPLGDEEDWILPDDFVDLKVEPPKYFLHVGRHPNCMNSICWGNRQVHNCDRCGNMEHNGKTCRQPLRTID
ncbi:uncharacterized protein LOC111023792 [Momordica charantia]|uniref:Uncharacterized protein LOC111023792 n=1 Tax=Momordica charantia TaxID=3673 RepID=A0A6J1DV50_MOMCH|nr:uncharacterized protein LOC111023792 [Momordica charantia]